jgi:PBSX family phage terminase large subunit
MKTVKRLYPPSPKAVYAFNEVQKYKYALLHGAVRSSKSHTLNVLAFHELKKLPPCNVLISGKNLSAVNRNIIEVWKEQLGAHKFRWHKLNDSGYYTIAHQGLTGKKFYTTGAGRDKDDEKIQGATFGYWLADEIALHTREFVMMAISRLSLPFSKARWSCNPDTPTHYIKTDFIDNPNAENFFHLLFTLDDNPSLTEEYKRETKSFYTGVFYKRMILGQWVAAEGAIYDMFDYDRHIIDYGSYDFREYKKLFIGVDYGYRNATVYLFCALRHDGKIDVLDEWYWSGKNSQETMDDDKLAQYMVEFTQRVIPNNDRTSFEIVVDPSAVSFIQMLRKYGFIVKNGVNKVLDGIHDVQTKLSKNKLRINKRCVNLIDEMQSYTWDEEMSLKKGVDTPTKVNDHCCFSGDTLVMVNNRLMRFRDIPETGVISGYDGKNISYSNGGYVKHDDIYRVSLKWAGYFDCTGDHEILTENGWVRADALVVGQKVYSHNNPNDDDDLHDKSSGAPTNRQEVFEEVWGECFYSDAVIKVEKIAENQPTYCVTTDIGCFSLAMGAIVSNCDALRYAIRTCVPEKYQ